MIRNVNKVHHEVRLLGIKIFSSDYIVTDIEESDEFEEVGVNDEVYTNSYSELVSESSNGKESFGRRFNIRFMKDDLSERERQVLFLEKLYRQGNNKTNLDDNLF